MPNTPADVSDGAPNAATYTINGDQTVTDNVTGLMWQQVVSTVGYSWSEAIAYCTTLTVGGYTDWRLPTKIELLSLMDFGAAFGIPKIDTVAFPNTPVGFVWSSTPIAGSPGAAWAADFGSDGGFAFANMVTNTGVRCVR